MKGPPEDANPPTPASNRLRDVDFSDYMWMGEEMEEFDKKCIQEFCEQDFIESCFEELFEEEERFAEEMERYLESLTSDQVDQLVHQLDAATLNDAGKESPCEIIFEKDSSDGDSQLNPNAPVFVPVLDQEDKPNEQ